MILNIYKPPGPTSHDIVDRVRKITGERKVGHAGTLDPFAEGVLVIGVGRESTKKLGEITKGTQKEYIAVIELGKTSTTGDPEGNIIKTLKHKNIETSDVKSVLDGFMGEIEQTPPIYSAIKIKGEPAYKKARRGEKVDMPKRRVKIYEIGIYNTDKYGLQRINADLKIGWEPPFLTIHVICSAGTYIRTLAEDIGKKLGTGAYVKGLIRTRVGEYKIESAITLDELRDGSLNP